MAFKKIFIIWFVISIVSGGLFYAIKTMIKGHPLWPWAIPYMYIGVLILFTLYVLTAPKKD
jgi:hypothetical protein